MRGTIPQTTSTAPEPASIDAGDFDDDKDVDLVIAYRGSDSVAILENQGDGSFSEPVTVVKFNRPNDVAVGDINGDQLPDLIVVESPFAENTGRVAVFQNDGHGLFEAVFIEKVGSRFGSVAAGDLDHDGDLDVVASESTSNLIYVLIQRRKRIVYLERCDTRTRGRFDYRRHQSRSGFGHCI